MTTNSQDQVEQARKDLLDDITATTAKTQALIERRRAVRNMSAAEFRQAVKDLSKPPAPMPEVDRADPPKTARDMSADEYAAARRAAVRS